MYTTPATAFQKLIDAATEYELILSTVVLWEGSTVPVVVGEVGGARTKDKWCGKAENVCITGNVASIKFEAYLD